MSTMLAPMLAAIVLAKGVVDCREKNDLLHREKRSDDVSIARLQAMFEQHAGTIQTLQSELEATKNALALTTSDTSSRLNAAESRLSSVESKVVSPTAFTVRFSTDPVTVGSKGTLKFNQFLTNMGGGYDTATGIFTAPVAGLYLFYLNLMENGNTEIEVKLMRNGDVMDFALANGDMGQGSYLTSLHLAKGDKVWNEHWWGATHFRGVHWTVFTGFLVMAD